MNDEEPKRIHCTSDIVYILKIFLTMLLLFKCLEMLLILKKHKFI